MQEDEGFGCVTSLFVEVHPPPGSPPRPPSQSSPSDLNLQPTCLSGTCNHSLFNFKFKTLGGPMPAKSRRSGFCVLAFALASLHAEEKTFGPQDLVDGLIQNNPEIQAARSRFEAATKRPSQVGTLPEPTASYTNFGVGHPFSRLNGSDFAYQGFGVSQELPFPGKLGLASEQAKREAESDIGKQKFSEDDAGKARAIVADAKAALKGGAK